MRGESRSREGGGKLVVGSSSSVSNGVRIRGKQRRKGFQHQPEVTQDGGVHCMHFR